MLQSYQHFNNYNLSACFIFDIFIFILKKPRCGYHIRGDQKKVEYKYTKISYIGLFIYNKGTKMYLGDLMELSSKKKKMEFESICSEAIINYLNFSN